MFAAVLINTLEFAEQSLEIHDKIRASNLPGLRDVLFADAGEIEFWLKGGRAGRSKLTLHMRIHAELELVCQRCLGKLDYPLDVDRRFELVADESALPESDMEDDEVDYLVIDPKQDVTALVQEEILLALPMVSRHEEDCTASGGAAADAKPNPFQVLEKLKVGPKN